MAGRIWVVSGLLVVGAGGLHCGQSSSGLQVGPVLSSGANSDAGSGPPPDAGADGGLPLDACHDLITGAPGVPVVYRSEFVPPHDLAETGTTDEQGNVLVAVSTHFDLVELFILDPAGVLLSNPPEATGASSFGRSAIGVADGFIGVQNIDSQSFGSLPAHRVAKVFPDGGTQQTQFDVGLGSQGEDPRGGMIVLVSETKTLTAHDPDLGPRWHTQLPITDWNPISNPLRLPVGVDTGGSSLVLFPRNPSDPSAGVMGIWTDAQGHPATAFDTGESGPAFCLRFMTSLTGGLFLQDLGCAPNADRAGKVVSSFQSLDPHPGPVPDWLVQRPGIDLRPIRGGAGYAAIGGQAMGPLTCSIEVLTPDGHSCGRVDFGPSVVASNFSATGANAGNNGIPCGLAVGSDGTVIARTEEQEPTQGLLRFSWHWWPAFFR